MLDSTKQTDMRDTVIKYHAAVSLTRKYIRKNEPWYIGEYASQCCKYCGWGMIETLATDVGWSEEKLWHHIWIYRLYSDYNCDLTPPITDNHFRTLVKAFAEHPRSVDTWCWRIRRDGIQKTLAKFKLIKGEGGRSFKRPIRRFRETRHEKYMLW